MSLPLHSPSLIMYTLLKNAGLVAGPNSTPWAGTYASVPDLPTNVVTVLDTTSDQKERLMNLTQIEYPGIQIRVRGENYQAAFLKLATIRNYLLTQVGKNRTPSIVTIGTTTYKIQGFHQTMGIVHLYKEEKNIAPVLTYNGTFTIIED